MPLINLLFWMMLLLTAYLTISLLSACYKAERKTQLQLLRLQTRQRVREQAGRRSPAAGNPAVKRVQTNQTAQKAQTAQKVQSLRSASYQVSASAVCGQNRSAAGAQYDSGRTPDRVRSRSSAASLQQKSSLRTGKEQMFVRPVSQSCRFQQVDLTHKRGDTTDLSFDWMRSVQKSVLPQQAGSAATCQQGQKSRHSCA